jgi:hypothetical protein
MRTPTVPTRVIHCFEKFSVSISLPVTQGGYPTVIFRRGSIISIVSSPGAVVAPKNCRLFGDASGRRLLARGLQNRTSCVCPADATELRAPTVYEFQASYSASIEVLKTQRVINDAFIETLFDIINVSLMMPLLKCSLTLLRMRIERTRCPLRNLLPNPSLRRILPLHLSLCPNLSLRLVLLPLHLLPPLPSPSASARTCTSCGETYGYFRERAESALVINCDCNCDCPGQCCLVESNGFQLFCGDPSVYNQDTCLCDV